MNDSKLAPHKIALCRHCSARVVYDDVTGWAEPDCDGGSGSVCPNNDGGHEPDNPHLTHLKNPARGVEWTVKS